MFAMINSSIMKSSFSLHNCCVLLVISVSLSFTSCDEEPTESVTNINITTKQPSENNTTQNANGSNSENNGHVSIPKTDEEKIELAVNTAIDIRQLVVKRIQTNDSIRMANREKMYAYQIGMPFSDLDEVFEEFNKFDNTEDFYVLKKSKRDYYLIKYDGKTEGELRDALSDFKNQLPADANGTAKIINLMSLCSKREKLVVGEKLTKRKIDTEIPCLICN